MISRKKDTKQIRKRKSNTKNQGGVADLDPSPKECKKSYPPKQIPVYAPAKND